MFLSNTRLCRNNTSQAIQPQFANYNRAKPDIRHSQVQLIPNVFMRHRFFHRSTTPFLNWNDSKIICIQIDFFSLFDSRESNLHNYHCFIVSFILLLIKFNFFRNTIKHQRHRYNIFHYLWLPNKIKYHPYLDFFVFIIKFRNDFMKNSLTNFTFFSLF